MKINKKTAERLIKKLNMDTKQVSSSELYQGLKVELEHGSKDPQTDVTHNDLTKTAKIAWAHLKEDKKYYQKLKVIEAKKVDAKIPKKKK